MSVTYHRDVIQNSDQWHDLRRGMVTASTVGTLITPSTIKPASNDKSRGLIALLASERITGWTEETYTSADMLRGIMDEPIARDLYAKHHAPVTECGFVTRAEADWVLGWSPDGLVGDHGAIEIKSRAPRAQVQTILADHVPVENIAQMQAGLFVSGRQWIDYVSYCGGLPLFIKRVTPDPRWHDAIQEATQRAEEAITETVSAFEAASDGLIPTERIQHFAEIEV